MKIEHSLNVKNRAAWHNWLTRNHKRLKECWIIFPKKNTGEPSITYEEALEEALCFGWIDSNIQAFDERTYGRRFSPRKPGSKWSAQNKKRIQKLIRKGSITESGRKALDSSGTEDDYGRTKQQKIEDLRIPYYFENELKKNRGARKYFQALAPSYRRNYLLWIKAAKTDETRKKRIRESIKLLAANKKLGMK
jgi:uncharacterized protein YdeI (YjbR/CyaY-like superfamily)